MKLVWGYHHNTSKSGSQATQFEYPWVWLSFSEESGEESCGKMWACRMELCQESYPWQTKRVAASWLMHLYCKSRRAGACQAMWWIYQYIVTTPVVVTSGVLTLLQDDKCFTWWPIHDSLCVDYFWEGSIQGMSLPRGKKTISSKITRVKGTLEFMTNVIWR